MDRLDELEVFVAILDAASLSGAARRLGRSAPAVTRALAALEARMGVRLVERTTRRLAATEAGARLGDSARRVLADYAQAVSQPDDGPLRGKLRITAPLVFGRRHVAPIVIDFLDAHPQLAIELVFNDRNIDLIEHGVDLAVRIGALPDTSMVARRVGAVRRLTVASPAYLARRAAPATPQELAGHDIVFSSATTQLTEWTFRAEGRELTVKCEPRLIVNEIDTLLMALAAGRGIGRALSYQAADLLATGALVRILTAYEPPPSPVQLVMASGRYVPPRLRACVDYLYGRLSALPVLQES